MVFEIEPNKLFYKQDESALKKPIVCFLYIDVF